MREGSFRRDMQTLSAKDAKYNFGRLIDTARAEPVTVEKHGRAVVVVLAVEEYERLKIIESEQRNEAPRSRIHEMDRKCAGAISGIDDRFRCASPCAGPAKMGAGAWSSLLRKLVTTSRNHQALMRSILCW